MLLVLIDSISLNYNKNQPDPREIYSFAVILLIILWVK